MIEWNTVAVIVAIAVSAAGLLKYVFYLLDKHKEHVAERFTDHHEKIQKNTEAIKGTEDSIQNTRDEMHRDYVHYEVYKDDKKNMHDLFGDNFKALFKKMDAVARDLNQLIGSHNGKVKSSIDDDVKDNDK